MYKSISGDTFETIARKVYGDDRKAYLLRKANPGVAEPLPSGVWVKVPHA